MNSGKPFNTHSQTALQASHTNQGELSHGPISSKNILNHIDSSPSSKAANHAFCIPDFGVDIENHG